MHSIRLMKVSNINHSVSTTAELCFSVKKKKLQLVYGVIVMTQRDTSLKVLNGSASSTRPRFSMLGRAGKYIGYQFSRGLRSQSCSSSESESGSGHGLFLTVNPIPPTVGGGGGGILPPPGKLLQERLELHIWNLRKIKWFIFRIKNLKGHCHDIHWFFLPF